MVVEGGKEEMKNMVAIGGVLYVGGMKVRLTAPILAETKSA